MALSAAMFPKGRTARVTGGALATLPRHARNTVTVMIATTIGEDVNVLILSRKRGQSIVVNDDIVVTVVAIDRNRVQIGIQAPGYVAIFRQEIVERMVAQGEIEPLECLASGQAASG